MINIISILSKIILVCVLLLVSLQSVLITGIIISIVCLDVNIISSIISYINLLITLGISKLRYKIVKST